jgi:hypothetical protein
MMKRTWAKALIMLSLFLAVIGLALLRSTQPVSAGPVAQLPTGSLPTVTSTFSGPMVVVVPGNEPQINLRAGPGALYERVGVLLIGQKVPARGKSPKDEWIQVEYPGAPGGLAWVYAYYVRIEPPTTLPIVEPPPTPTLAQTATIDPTLAARFVITFEPTRLPTFTAPPPLSIATFTAENSLSVSAVPMGFVILGLAGLGLFLGVVAFSQR